MRNEEEINRAIDRYADTVTRICLAHLKNTSDTEDIFQEVFLKYALCSVRFESDEHERAWLIRVTLNQCRDLSRRLSRHPTVSLDDVENSSMLASSPDTGENEERQAVRTAVRSLPEKYREVIYLYYYEELSAVKIAEILGKNVNTVYTLLARAKKLLEKALTKAR